ncbi:Lipoate-protein ligase A [compost metagenome]
MRSRVANLCELLPGIDHQQVNDALIEAFFHYYGERVAPEHISPEQMPDLPGFAETFARQRSWEWNFGHAPAFSHQLDERFGWGGVELHFDVEKGVIGRAQIFSDSLDPAPLDALAERLVGVPYKPEAMAALLHSLMGDFPARAHELAELEAWLVTALR